MQYVWFEISVAVGATPYFYNLPQTIHVYDHIAIGTSVFAVSAKDDDSDYDGISLTLSTPSSYFTLSTGYYNDHTIELLACFKLDVNNNYIETYRDLDGCRHV